MSGVRVLAGTRKGAFILTSDGKRGQWDVSGPHFAGWEVYHLKSSPVSPDRLYASHEIKLGELLVQVANPKMLYLMKKDTVRLQDRADAARIREAFGLGDE